MKCKDCGAYRKGFFKSKPEEYVCIGVFEPFVIKDINSNCTEYMLDGERLSNIKRNETMVEEIWSWNETYSDDWTHYTFDSKEEAIEDAIDTLKLYKKNLGKIKIGKCEFVPLRTDVDPDRVMEDLDEMYCDETGCDYYIYEGVTDKQRQWLEDKLSDVMVEFHKMIGLNPCWFKVVEEEEIDLCEYEKEKK